MSIEIAESIRTEAEPVAEHPDYRLVQDAVAYISEAWQRQPSLAEVARHVGAEPLDFQRRFTRLAGLTPKTFLQSVTLDRARALLTGERSLLDSSLDLGLSGPGRLHDLFVTHEAMTPGEFRRGGEGLQFEWGVHPSPFGDVIILANGGRLAGLGFVEDGESPLRYFAGRWPKAGYVRDEETTRALARRIFDRSEWQGGTPLRLVLIGTDFEIRVWRTLLGVPFAAATSYGAVARGFGREKAARAVGAAVGRNPISFVVPCHRVLGADGSLTGYLWGTTRKRAILGWEAGIAAEAATATR